MTQSHPAALASDAELVRGRFRVGAFEVALCSDGPFLLDGGAMFGVVPKTLWQKQMPADADNRVLLGLNTVVVRAGRHVVLIETGIGNKQPEKLRTIHGHTPQLPQSLQAAGVDPAEVTHVLNTHLHFDHCGWNTTLQPDGIVTPTFPNAQYFAPAGEVEHGRRQFDRDRVSYLAPNYEPLIASGQMTLLEPRPTAEIVPGIWVEWLPGHTVSMMGVHLENGGEHACYVGDLIPTRQHLQPTWVMGFDLDPMLCIENRKRFLARAVADRWTVVFPHDHHVPAAQVRLDEKGRFVAEPVVAFGRGEPTYPGNTG